MLKFHVAVAVKLLKLEAIFFTCGEYVVLFFISCSRHEVVKTVI
jgi:hypothetical protein